MAAKDRSASANKKLKAQVKKVRSKLDRAQARTDRSKRQVSELEQTNSKLEAQVKELKAQVKELKKRNKLLGKASPAPEGKPALTTEPAVLTDGPSDGPDASWTVVQLRAEARSRGLTGFSHKTKAQLLAALR